MPPAPIAPSGALMSQTNNNPLQGGAYYSDFLKGGSLADMMRKTPAKKYEPSGLMKTLGNLGTLALGATKLASKVGINNYSDLNNAIQTGSDVVSSLGLNKGSGYMGDKFGEFGETPAQRIARGDYSGLPTTDMGMERYRERMGLNRPAVRRPAVERPQLFKAPALARGLVDDLHEAGLAGNGSHKAQYVRWMLGRVRGNRTGDVYRNPYAKDDKRKPVAVSNPKDTPYAGWSPGDWEGKHSPFDPHKVNGELVSPFIQNMKKKRVFKIKPKAKAPRNEVVEAPPAPAEKFPKGQKLTQRELDEAIIHLYQRDKLTTRAIVKKLKDDYDLTTSQPTVARRIKAFNDGVIDATGKRL